MKLNTDDITFSTLNSNASIPYHLLLIADPSKEIVDSYLQQSLIFIAEKDKEVVGVIVLFQLSEEAIEIKNIAVRPAFQNQGIGSLLIANAIIIATARNYKRILIGTANSSLAQLHLYQKLGFEISEIKKDFFIKNYPDSIYENGIQAKHLLVLSKEL
jgi:ribosomal protein S18 acetylase RimI-like enzyme